MILLPNKNNILKNVKLEVVTSHWYSFSKFLRQILSGTFQRVSSNILQLTMKNQDYQNPNLRRPRAVSKA
jgi:hypothetical protein